MGDFCWWIPMRNFLRGLSIIILIAIVVFTFDAWTKFVCSHTLKLNEEVPVAKNFTLAFVQNSDFILTWYFPRLVPVTKWINTNAWLFVVLAMSGIALFRKQIAQRSVVILLYFGLLIGGVTSNSLDLMRHRAVTDYLGISDCWITNFADIAIVVGVSISFIYVAIGIIRELIKRGNL